MNADRVVDNLPMFPLGSVVLPGGQLPLHIFEPRYRQLVQDLLASDEGSLEFGTVMIERGREVGGGDQRATVGTIVTVVDVRVSDDGRYGVMAVGVERLRVIEWLPDDPYPKASIERWPDEADPPGSTPVDALAIERLREQLEECFTAMRALGDAVPDTLPPSSTEAQRALYELASWSPISVADLHAVLAAPSTAQRFDVLAGALDDAAAVLKFRGS
ncbi:MAG TPA: LON peptidase substrate-binding domain-containing protein [Ilumatobacter sp.]|nr:LON peptidase substrate-binding domain-containing protein [Ilumatobacter sp.]